MQRINLCWLLFASLVVLSAREATAADATPVFSDFNAEGGDNFTTGTAFGGGPIGLDDMGPFVVFNQTFNGSTGGGGFAASISNGENGIDQTFDGSNNEDVNDDVPNEAPVNPVFAEIGNASGKLENGNVIRFSAWVRSDPAAPITVDPQIQPVFKLEFWKEAASGNQDTNGSAFPSFGDKVFDQDINGSRVGLLAEDLPQWVDFDGDGEVADFSAGFEDRVSSITTDEWTLVETTYTVNDFDWLGIGDDIYTVADIEEVRGVMFFGDFTSKGDDGSSGNLLADNILLEVFADAASVTANTNPEPPSIFGDYNGDSLVNAADYTIWRDNVDGEVPGFDGDDYGVWNSNFGSSLSSTAAGVPEPGAAVLALVCLTAGGVARRVD